MTYFTPDNIESLAVTAISAAAYLDACDEGAKTTRLDPGYYQACGNVLRQIFSLIDPTRHFARILEHSAAARDVAESVRISSRLGLSRHSYYPELVLALHRAAA